MEALDVAGIKVDKKNTVSMFSMERENFEFLSIPTIPLRHERETQPEVLESTYDPHFLASVFQSIWLDLQDLTGIN